MTTNRSRPIPILGLLAILVLLLAACGGAASETPSEAPASEAPASEAAGGAGETVSLAGGQFSPGELTILAGTTVTFTDTSGHTVTEGSDGAAADDPIIDEQGGADIVFTFEEAGTYDITCTIHPSMNMTITVES